MLARAEAAGSRADAGSARARRLPVCQPGHGARRVRGTRLTARSVPERRAPPPAYRPARRRGRQHPHLRSRQPALDREGERGTLAPGPGILAHRDGHRSFSRRLASALRGGPQRLPGLSGRQPGIGPGRRRVLLAPVPRAHRDAVRLPGAGDPGGGHRGCARRGRRSLAGGALALRAGTPRSGKAFAFPWGAVPERRRDVRGAQPPPPDPPGPIRGHRHARLHRLRDPGAGRHPGGRALARPVGGAEAIPRRFRGAHPGGGRDAGPARAFAGVVRRRRAAPRAIR